MTGISNAELPSAVTVEWHHSLKDADDAMREHLARVLGPASLTLRIWRLCPRCGSDRHGRPGSSAHVHISLSRSGAYLVTAASKLVPVGVDVESIAAIATRWDPAAVLHPADRADTAEEQAALWCRKEAILKAAGTGLAVPMSSVRVANHQVFDLDAPDGFRAAVAVASSDHR